MIGGSDPVTANDGFLISTDEGIIRVEVAKDSDDEATFTAEDCTQELNMTTSLDGDKGTFLY